MSNDSKPGNGNIDITVVITAHREGPLLLHTLRSARVAITTAEAEGHRCELLLILDRPDEETRATAERLLGPDDRLISVDFGDPSQARNTAVSNARGLALALLDGDDLFGNDWLTKGFAALSRHAFGEVCLHPEFTVIFGEEKGIWHHIGMENSDFQIQHTMFENYFTNLSLAPTQVYRNAPFRATAFRHGFGHEDWAWIRETMHHGIKHLVVPGTLHGVRRKPSSRLVRSRIDQHLTIPTALFSGREVHIY